MSRLDDLIRELRRRKVVRVAIAYAAAAFVVLQAADIILPGLGMDSAMRLVIMLVAVGFPLAIGLSWAFDADRSGIRRTPDAPGRRTSLFVPVAAASLLVVVVAAGWRLLRDDGAADTELDPRLVAVIPFRVSADASLEYLREGMVDLLGATLTGESGPRAADPRTTLSAWRRVVESEDQDLTPEEALGVARMIGAGNVLLGSVVGSTSRLTMTARIVALPSGREGPEAHAEGPADSLSVLVDRITAQLLSLQAGETSNRLAGFTSTSLPAVRAYLRGQAHYRRANFPEAARAFDDALQLDSTFALAALGLSLVSNWFGTDVPLRDRAGELAERFRDRLAPADRAILDARMLSGRVSVREEVDAWERTTERYPDRPEAWFTLGDVLLHSGRAAEEPDLERRWKDAFDRTLQLDSSFTPALIHLIDAALVVDAQHEADTTEFRRLYALLERRETSPAAAELRRSLRFIDTAAARVRRDTLDRIGTIQLLFIAIRPLVSTAPIDDTERAAEVLVQRTLDDPNVSDPALWQTTLFALNDLGRPAAARTILERAIERAPDPAPWLAEAIDFALLAGGDSTFAEAAAERIAHVDHPFALCAAGRWRAWTGRPIEEQAARLEARGMLADSLCAELIRTTHSVVTNAADRSTRLASLDAKVRAGPPILAYGGELLLINLTLARLHEAMGDDAAALRAIRRRPSGFDGHRWFAEALEYEGRLAAATGDRDTAIRALSRWLELRSRAEPSFQPRIDNVRAELARLTAESNR